MSGQTLTDRIAAAQYQLTGSDMARAVCKATTHEVMAPKKKHLECKCSPSSSSFTPHGMVLQAYRPHAHMQSRSQATCHHNHKSCDTMTSRFLNSLCLNGCGALMN